MSPCSCEEIICGHHHVMLCSNHKGSASRIGEDYAQSRWMEAHGSEMIYFTSWGQREKKLEDIKVNVYW